MSKAHFTTEQLQAAQSVSALDYAKAHGYNLVAVGNRYQLREHDSMVFLPDGRWYWNSTRHYGRALEFLVYYEQKKFTDAVLELAGEDHNAFFSQPHISTPSKVHSPTTPFVLPPSSTKDIGILVKYLVERRGCDKEIVKTLISEKRVYISCQQRNGGTIRNAVFVGTDRDGVPRSATIRGINYGSHFKAAVPGSDKHIPFALPAMSDATTLAIFEAPIDAISHASIDKENGCVWTATARIALSGNPAPRTVEDWLQIHPQINRIELCLDNDAAGRLMDARLRSDIAKSGFSGIVQTVLPPIGKDWNDALLENRKKEVNSIGCNTDRSGVCHQFQER